MHSDSISETDGMVYFIQCQKQFSKLGSPKFEKFTFFLPAAGDLVPIRCKHVSPQSRFSSDPDFLNLAVQLNFATHPAKVLLEHVNGLLSLRKTQNRPMVAVKVL